MYVIEATPLIRGTIAQELSYYSATSYPAGSIILIPLRNKKVFGLVTNNKPVSKAKTALRAATFSLKKLEPQTTENVIPESIINTAKELSRYYPASLGAIIYALLPPDVRNGTRFYPQTTSADGQEDTTPSIFTGIMDDRYLAYQSRIREAFAHRASVLLVVPTSISVFEAAEKLSHGIEKRVITFSSVHTKRQLEKSYKEFDDLSKAKLIICTPNFAMLERHDLTTIIVDESGSPHYKARTRPYLDTREVLKAYARTAGKSILLGDTLPLTEDEVKRREEIYQTREEHPKRLTYPSSFEIVKHSDEPGADFSIFTPQLADEMKLTLKNKGRVFLFAARKGLSPLVTCYDCNYIFRCPDSGAPYSLFRTNKNGEEQRWFVCTTSGKKERAADTCPVCNSWRLREQGIGIQQVEDAAKESFPKSTVLRLDHASATTYRKAERIMKEFYETKNSILVGTAMTLPYLKSPVDMTAVTSYEALKAMPTWRAEEQVLSIILKLRERTLKDCFIQMRTEEDKLIKEAKSGALDEFYEDEISVRQAVKYPPYSTFVLLTYTGNKDQVVQIEENLIGLLAGYKIQSYSTPVPRTDTHTRHTLIRIKQKDWPDQHLMDTLRTLPPNIKIEVDPMKIV